MSPATITRAPGPMLGRLTLIAVGLALTLCASGCATVPVYQRERVTDRIMSFNAQARVDMRLMKSFDAREGSTGGTGGAGGGCACK